MTRIGQRETKFKVYSYRLGSRVVKGQGYEPQALDYLTKGLGIDPADILCECETVPLVEYTYRGTKHTYHPDLYIRSKRVIVEVKSYHTLGVNHNKKRGWSMTCAKAKACHERGFKFMLLLMDKNGRRMRLPKNWALMKKQEFLAEVDRLNPKEERIGLFSI